jgi:putative membrane protein
LEEPVLKHGEGDQRATSTAAGASELLVVPVAASRHRWAQVTALNWRLFLVRVLVSGVAVVVTVAVVPGLGFTGWRTGQFAVVALVYATLTAIVKPVLEFLALRFLVATYGLVVIVINAALLFALAQVLDELIVYDRVWQLLLGGFVVGFVGLVLETAVGASEPVLDHRQKG